MTQPCGVEHPPVMLTSVFSVGATTGETKSIPTNANATATKKMNKIYLAHPWAEQEYGRQLQKKLEAMGFTVTNPFDPVNLCEYDKLLSKGYTFPDFKEEKQLTVEMVRVDLKRVKEADIVVAVYTPILGIGTSCETFYNSYVLQRQTFVLYSTVFGYKRVHPWLVAMTDVSLTEEELLQKLERRKNQ